MEGREDKKSNDLFFLCSLIDYIARKTKNHRRDVVNALGKKRLAKIYELADVYHSDNIDEVSEDFIEQSGLQEGDFDNVALAQYSIPSHWDIGKVYKRLILGAAREQNTDIITTLINVYNSFISEKLDDYNSSFYYEVPSIILLSYLDNEIY